MTTSKMTCEAFDAALSDYLEGTLDDSARASVERHLSECLRCSALVRDLENIRKNASMLPDLVPSRDLWQGIEARIAAPVIPLAARPDRIARQSGAIWHHNGFRCRPEHNRVSKCRRRQRAAQR